MLLGILLMEVNIIKMKGSRQKKYAKAYQLLFELLAIILEKRLGLFFPGL